MADTRRSVGPWVTAAVAGAVLVALLIVYFVVFLPYRRDHTVGQLSSTELQAMEAATTELNTIGSLGGKNFAQAYRDALAGATGGFKHDLIQEEKTAKKNLAGNGVTAQVTQRALIGPVQGAGLSGYQLLMNLSSSADSAAGLLLSPQQVTVTIVRQGGKWLVSDVQTAGVVS